jgi:hypothetical protein
MNLLKYLENISFQKLTGITILAAITLAIPVSVWVAQQQTKTQSKAYFEKPEPIVPEKKYGSPSEGSPQITLVWPFLGKTGDSVLIEGSSFGNNPVNKSLFIGNTKIKEEDIIKWTPSLIEFVVPQNLNPGSYQNLNLSIAGKGAVWDFPFTVYTIETKTQVTENNDVVKVLNPPSQGQVEIYFKDEVIESPDFKATPVPSNKTIISVLVKDKNNNPLPFFVEPAEFGF